MSSARNVLGTPLLSCSFDPLTGFYRDGRCRTHESDGSSHVICAKLRLKRSLKLVALDVLKAHALSTVS